VKTFCNRSTNLRLGTSLLLALVGAACAQADGPSVGKTEVLGPFTGHDAALHPDNLEPERVDYYGTDLGFSYEHQGRLHFLFGDTVGTNAGAFIGRDTGQPNDDIFGTIELAEWPDPAKINPDNLPQLRLGQRAGSTSLAAIDPGFAMDGLKTPEAGFSSGEREFAVLILTKPRGCTTDEHCGPNFSCDTGLGYIGVRPDQEVGLTLGCVDDAPACASDPLLGPNGQPVPGSGLCVDKNSSVWDESPGGRFSSVAMKQRIGMRDLENPALYARVADWLTSRFLNTTTRTVRDFDPARGAGPAKHDYRPATGTGPNQRVLLWGRPGFIGVGSKDRHMNLYLAYADLPAAPDFPWRMQFFTGVDANGAPQFSPDEREAAELDLDDSTPGTQPDEVHDVIQHMSIAWVGQLNKWIMFYGGGIDVTPNPAFGLLDCGILQVFVQSDCKEVEVGNGAIYMRSADDPWGPWSAPQEVIAGGDPDVAGSGQYGPGGMLYHPSCEGETCATHSPIPTFPENGYGWLYGTNIIEPWITPAGEGVDVIWNASTWDPYRVILLRTHIDP
jgi:hypothetical protein